jgi:hypothetical protein
VQNALVAELPQLAEDNITPEDWAMIGNLR